MIAYLPCKAVNFSYVLHVDFILSDYIVPNTKMWQILINDSWNNYYTEGLQNDEFQIWSFLLHTLTSIFFYK